MENFTFKQVDFTDKELMAQIYALRFQVYCYECGFIKEEDYPNKLESDKYDAQSVHFAAIGEDGSVTGAMRLISKGEHAFPIEDACEEVVIDHDAVADVGYGEVSRFVIDKRVRRRRADSLYYEPQINDKMAVAQDGQVYMRRARPMAFGLYRELFQYSKSNGITHWYSLMEKSLWLLLKIHGISFKECGEGVDYYGPVRPYIAKVDQIIEEVSKKFPKFYEYFVAEDTTDVSLDQLNNEK